MAFAHPEMLLQKGLLRIRYLPGTGSILVVSFSGVGNARAEEPKLEFPGIASDGGKNHVLFITDQSRSWLNGPGVAAHIQQAITAVKEQYEITRCVGIGNSMGGTMALQMSCLVEFDIVIALTPQFSVVPGAVPQENRWMYFRNRIKAFTYPDVSELRTDRTRYVILHGDESRELAHATRFPQLPGTINRILPDCGHLLARQLKEKGVLKPMIQHGIAGRYRRLRATLSAAGTIPTSHFLDSPSLVDA